MRDWKERLLFAEANMQEVLSTFDIETKLVLVGLKRYLKELFGSHLILKGNCKEMISLLATLTMKVGCDLIIECFNYFQISYLLRFNTLGGRLTNMRTELLMK